MIFKADYYSDRRMGFPDRENKNLDKDSMDYNLAVAQHVYSEFSRGTTYIDYNWYRGVSENRKYAKGLQDRELYEDAFYGTDDGNIITRIEDNANNRRARRKAYANLNFEIQSPMPVVMDAIVNKLSTLVNRVSVNATDKYSGAERENLKWGAYIDGKFRKEFDSLRAMMALPQQELGYTPKSIEELNLFEAEGGFKLSYEEVMERLLKYSFEQSGWEENIVERIITDLVTLGYAAVEDVYDKITGQVKTKYLDAEYAGVQYTREDGYKKPDYGFYIQLVKLSDLRTKINDDEKLLSLAKNYSNWYGNPNFDDWNKQTKNTYDLYNNIYDEYLIPVFTVKWIDVEFKNEKQYKNRQGKIRTKVVEKKYKPKDREKLLVTRIKVVREVSWPIDSDLVYDYGKSEFQGRDGLSEPVLPIHMVKVTGRPIVPRLKPSLDQYMMAWMRLQQGISMAAMNGYAINMDAVSNLSMGGKKFEPREVLRFWRQTGTLFFKTTDVSGRPNGGSAPRPIEQLPGGAGAVIAESIQMMDIAMREVERLTGVNAITLGVQPSPQVGKAVTEFSLAGTNDILRGVLKQANVLKSDVARAKCLRLQHVVSSDPTAKKAYVDVIGETSLELLKISDGGDVRYGIRTHARPTEMDIAELKEMISLSLKNGRDGKVGITEADFIRFNSMINAGASLKRVALLLDFANKKAQEEAEERAARAQQLDQQGAQQLAAQKDQIEAQSVIRKAQADVLVSNAKSKGKILEQAVSEGTITWNEALYRLDGGDQPQSPVVQPQEEPPGTPEDRVVPVQEEAV